MKKFSVILIIGIILSVFQTVNAQGQTKDTTTVQKVLSDTTLSGSNPRITSVAERIDFVAKMAESLKDRLKTCHIPAIEKKDIVMCIDLADLSLSKAKKARRESKKLKLFTKACKDLLLAQALYSMATE